MRPAPPPSHLCHGRLARPCPFTALLLVLLLLTFPHATNAQATRLAATRPALPAGVHVLRDLEYIPNGHPRNRLDLYLPDDAPAHPLPVIVWVHGGGWTNGDKANNCPAIPFVKDAYAVASVNYRFSQHAIFPAQIQDCKAALRFLRAHANEYNLDPNHIGAWGASSGGHLVALLGTTANVKDFDTGPYLDQPSAVQAVVDWCGPTDFLTCGIKDTRTNLIGANPLEHPDKAKYASPINYVSKSAAPFLIMHGQIDDTVPFSQSESFYQALKSAGAPATFVPLPNTKHGNGLYKSPQTLRQVLDFFNQHLHH